MTPDALGLTDVLQRSLLPSHDLSATSFREQRSAPPEELSPLPPDHFVSLCNPILSTRLRHAKDFIQHLDLLRRKVRPHPGSRSRHRRPSGVLELALEDLLEPGKDERVRSSVLRLFLSPDVRLCAREARDVLGEFGVREGRDFLEGYSAGAARREGGRTSTRMKAIVPSRDRSLRSLTRS